MTGSKRTDPEIHGEDGLGGVQGLPDLTDAGVTARIERSKSLKAIDGIAKAIKETWKDGEAEKVPRTISFSGCR